MLQHNPELKSQIEQLWNKFWAGGISNPLTAIEQITYLLFMKRLDEMDLKNQSDAEFIGDPYTSRFEGVWVPPEHRDKKKENQKPFAVEKKTLRWSEFKHYHAEEMLTHVQTRVFPFLKDMNGAESGFTHHMKNAVFIIPKPMLLVESEIASAGKNGRKKTAWRSGLSHDPAAPENKRAVPMPAAGI